MARLAVSSPMGWSKRIAVNSRHREAVTGILFASPWIFGFLTLMLGPMLFSLYASFTDYDIINAPHWTGLNNFSFIFQSDPRFRIALGNTFWYVLVKTPVVIIVSLFVAILLNQNVPGQRVFRTVLYMPTVLTGVAAIFLWMWILSPYGILNIGLSKLHVNGPGWFYDPSWTKPGMVVIGLWYIGTPVILLLAGLKNIPQQLYEAAEVDGAGFIRKFWNITIPMLSPTLFFIVITGIIGAFQVFNTAYVISTSTTGQSHNPGDPQQSLLFYEVYVFDKFQHFEMGYAMALSWVLFVVIMIITLIQLYLSKKWVYYEA